jgi:integrase
LAELQRHVDRRADARGIGGKLSPATVRKEIVTLRTAWNWAVDMNLLSGRFPNKGLRYPKRDEKPPFQTRAEIERKVAAGGLTRKQIDELWDALFLTLPEIEELLEYVREHAGLPWVYPVFGFAAHTGARRSEIIRAQVADLDFEGRSVLLREKKRAHDRRTTRRVPLTPFLSGVLREWLTRHPGGPHLFCQPEVVDRSKKRSRTTGHRSGKGRATTMTGRSETVTERTGRPGPEPLTKDESHDHFKRTLARSKWAVLRGWHICRHSFASNCAAGGVDQRLLDAWLGHTTEIRKRYLHLIPANEQRAIDSVFGTGGAPPVET